ncbi:unnamed protein product, partial [Meganyctiphanes norvegica]
MHKIVITMLLPFDHRRLPVFMVVATVFVGCGGDQYTVYNNIGNDDSFPPISITPLSRAWSWVMSQRQENWGWGDETPHTILALSLANSSWFTRENLKAQLITKQLEMDLTLRLWRFNSPPTTDIVVSVVVTDIVTIPLTPYGFSPRLLRLPLRRPVGHTNYNITYLKHDLARQVICLKQNILQYFLVGYVDKLSKKNEKPAI